MEPRVEPGHEPGLLWKPQTLGCRGCLFSLFLCKSWFESGFLAQLDRPRDRKTRECLAGRQRPHPHVELGHADPMPSLEGACQDSLYSDLLSFLLSLCTREHDTHLDVVNAQAP